MFGRPPAWPGAFGRGPPMSGDPPLREGSPESHAPVSLSRGMTRPWTQRVGTCSALLRARAHKVSKLETGDPTKLRNHSCLFRATSFVRSVASGPNLDNIGLADTKRAPVPTITPSTSLGDDRLHVQSVIVQEEAFTQSRSNITVLARSASLKPK